MPGLFANGSTIEQPMGTRSPLPPTAPQPADQYWDQSYRNLSGEDASIHRALDRDGLLERGRDLAGFIRRDRRAELDGLRFSWELTRAPAWPAELPPHIRQALDQVITADRAAHVALVAAKQGYDLWKQQNPNAPDDVCNVERYRLIAGPETATQRAADQLDRALIGAVVIVEAIEQRIAIDRAAPGRRAAIEREYQKQLEQVDRDQQAARMAAQQAIARF